MLPESVKQLYIDRYREFIEVNNLQDKEMLDYNESDPNKYQQVILNEARQAMSLLEAPTPIDNQAYLKQMVNWCQRWDKIYGYNAVELYPELADIFETYAYKNT